MSNSGDLGRTWLAPGFALLAGVVFLIGSWLGGHPGVGAVMLGIMVAFAAGLLLVSRYSETVRGLLDHRDERLSAIDLRATAAAGGVLILVVIGAAVVELARGHSGAPYTWLGAVAGVTYVISVVV